MMNATPQKKTSNKAHMFTRNDAQKYWTKEQAHALHQKRTSSKALILQGLRVLFGVLVGVYVYSWYDYVKMISRCWNILITGAVVYIGAVVCCWTWEWIINLFDWPTLHEMTSHCWSVVSNQFMYVTTELKSYQMLSSAATQVEQKNASEPKKPISMIATPSTPSQSQAKPYTTPVRSFPCHRRNIRSSNIDRHVDEQLAEDFQSVEEFTTYQDLKEQQEPRYNCSTYTSISSDSRHPHFMNSSSSSSSDALYNVSSQRSLTPIGTNILRSPGSQYCVMPQELMLENAEYHHQMNGNPPNTMMHRMLSRDEAAALTYAAAPDIDQAISVLDTLGLAIPIFDLCDNARRLLGRHLQDFTSAFAVNCQELVELGICRELLEREIYIQPIFRTTSGFSRSNVSLVEMLTSFDREPYFNSKIRPGVNLIAEHRHYDRYLALEGTSAVTSHHHPAHAPGSGNGFPPQQSQPPAPRAHELEPEQLMQTSYVISRLFTLSEDGFMGKYRWNRGGSWKGKEWTPEFPTDAQVAMNVFCSFMDGLLPPAFEGDHRPFRRVHYMSAPPTAHQNIRGRYLIFQSQELPTPHYRVIVNGALQEVMPGKKNIFHAIVLFLYAIKQQKSGYLGNINLHQILERIFECTGH